MKEGRRKRRRQATGFMCFSGAGGRYATRVVKAAEVVNISLSGPRGVQRERAATTSSGGGSRLCVYSKKKPCEPILYSCNLFIKKNKNHLWSRPSPS